MTERLRYAFEASTVIKAVLVAAADLVTFS